MTDNPLSFDEANHLRVELGERVVHWLEVDPLRLDQDHWETLWTVGGWGMWTNVGALWRQEAA